MKIYSVFLILTVLLYSCQQDTERTKPTLIPLTESVYSSFILEPDSFYAVHASIGGIIEQKMISEGDLVSKGQIIAIIENNTQELTQQNSKLALELSRANYSGKSKLLIELENELHTAKIKYKSDSIKYYNQLRLWNQEVGTKNELDSRELTYGVSRNNLKTLTNKLNRTKKELKVQFKKAENDFLNSRLVGNEYMIQSRIDGMVYEVLKNAGELVLQQEPIALIGSEKNFVIKMLVDEVDIIKIHLGQKVLVVLDAYGEEVFIAKVNKIFPSINKGTQTFTVEALFDKQPDLLYSGLAGEANIIISSKKEVLTIPLNYLINNRKVKTEAGEVEVKVGLRNLSYVEILSGLDTTSVIIKPE